MRETRGPRLVPLAPAGSALRMKFLPQIVCCLGLIQTLMTKGKMPVIWVPEMQVTQFLLAVMAEKHRLAVPTAWCLGRWGEVWGLVFPWHRTQRIFLAHCCLPARM